MNNSGNKSLDFGGGTTIQPRIISHCMYAFDCRPPLCG